MRYKTLLSIRKIVISYKYTFCKFTFWFSYIQLISKFLLQRKKFSKTFCTYLTKWKVLLFCNTTKMIRKITLNLIQQHISIKNRKHTFYVSKISYLKHKNSTTRCLEYIKKKNISRSKFILLKNDFILMRIVIIIKGTKIQQPTTAYVTTTTTIKTNSLKIINWLIYTL